MRLGRETIAAPAGGVNAACGPKVLDERSERVGHVFRGYGLIAKKSVLELWNGDDLTPMRKQQPQGRKLSNLKGNGRFSVQERAVRLQPELAKSIARML